MKQASMLDTILGWSPHYRRLTRHIFRYRILL